MERFACGTQVVAGADALQVLGELPCRRLLMVTAPEWTRQGAVERIRQAAGYPETVMFESFEAMPTMQRAVEGSRKIREFRPELVVALGNEGILDLGKAMTCFSKHPCTLAAVPLALGTGTEVTDRVILSHNGHRHLLKDHRIQPQLAILDHELIARSPREAIAEGGFALLAAALESYAGRDGGPLADLHAREGFVSAWAVLPAAFSGSGQARARLWTASVLTGLAQGGLGLCRAMENSLGAVLGLSRGRAAALLLPAVVGCNAHAAGKQYAVLARAAGLGGSREDIGSRNLKAGLIRLRRELGLPETLVQAGVELRTVWGSSRKIVELTLEDPACRNNPVAVDDFLVRRILEEITGRI